MCCVLVYVEKSSNTHGCTEPPPCCVTVTVACPVLPSLVAVIVAVPGAMPRTSPLDVTVATDVLELDHVMVRPLSALPFWSLGVAVSWSVPPTWIVPDEGETVTVATAGCVLPPPLLPPPLLPPPLSPPPELWSPHPMRCVLTTRLSM